ncbi:N-acetyldiaminopimelate deacetylase [Aneurinibacillus thermoaerophilus]|jgi:N-acetyldiaminopimelate deacetylase|uniref:N-acetyldiaminopimelate deacetylase n=1 Tax=Aneurinibacillus thermoaerophilus TaxID=143495 RepID=A0A1G8CQN0_ANETH|nr:N-acetyldiaminopimelate deacetylase [Aneurinibacillus thermoaerophilus]MED0680486.1 N-acetyldiaminopimelate deacetylase [Aneurinibacillus thermoaerophilus]MED0737254.1 N-acetyldiaminopimelate deacetylase [Aneurinibacillus thermoaerophilus]MED0764874.1 N-acetyldiaminopimelate deacetylase [Aneurinibacillus thermoaerophilus]QYY42394.1 N-acetyldiaminopimelate deacetylase [Aneurinibacillus thermoaerophilus]SDH47742.1 N-acetyldiaminopimelate deacetylase [Aneurinibacillus thermoaerophilus]
MNAQPFIAIRRELHKIPEPGFAEFKTQRFLLDYLATLPQERMEIKTWRTGILIKVKGANPTKRLGYRADMDGLPIPEETSYAFKSTHPGYMHACGHDMHMAIALGVLTYFVENQVKDDLIFIFQPAEEGPGGAQPMLASEEFNEWRPDAIFALHIAPEYPVGTIALKPGILFANTSELFIDLYGKGGHAAFPHTANDMVIAAAHLATQLQSIVSRNIDPLDSAVVTIGKIEGGTKQNIIAEKARLEGTIRTLSMESMQKVKSRIEALVRGTEAGFECQAAIDYGANYCQVYNDETLTHEFMNWVKDTGVAALIECKTAMTGEDFGYFLAEIPGFLFWLGVDTPYGLHHAKIEPNESAIEVAIRVLTQYLSWKAS